METKKNFLHHSPVIDFSAHVVLSGHVPESMKPLDEIIGPVHNDLELIADFYESAGVDGAVLSQPPWMGSSNLDGVVAANDALLDEVNRYEQFYALAAIPTAAGPDAAADEFERCLDAGYNGGAIETVTEGISIDHPTVKPILEIADDEEAPLLIHPKIDNSLHPDVLDDKYRLNAIFGREAAISESIFEVIHGGILDEYPNLNLVFHHLGGNIASMMGRVKLHLDIGRWPNQDMIKPWSEFKTQLESRIYIDTSGFFGYHAPLQSALSEFPPSQILFGTDFPYEPRDVNELHSHAKSVTDVTNFNDSAMILGDNAISLMANV